MDLTRLESELTAVADLGDLYAFAWGYLAAGLRADRPRAEALQIVAAVERELQARQARRGTLR